MGWLQNNPRFESTFFFILKHPESCLSESAQTKTAQYTVCGATNKKHTPKNLCSPLHPIHFLREHTLGGWQLFGKHQQTVDVFMKNSSGCLTDEVMWVRVQRRGFSAARETITRKLCSLEGDILAELHAAGWEMESREASGWAPDSPEWKTQRQRDAASMVSSVVKTSVISLPLKLCVNVCIDWPAQTARYGNRRRARFFRIQTPVNHPQPMTPIRAYSAGALRTADPLLWTQFLVGSRLRGERGLTALKLL